jgi:hypothetical protein
VSKLEEPTKLGEYAYVYYYQGRIVFSDSPDTGSMGTETVELDGAAMDAFDRWRAELKADIELRKAAGF